MSVILIPMALLMIVGIVALSAIVIGRSGRSRLLMIGLVAALLLLLGVGGVVLVLRMNQTHLLVTAPPETAFVGKVTVDGVEHRIEGNGTQTLTYSGGRVEYTIIPTTVDPSQTLTVTNHGQKTGSAHGAHGEVKRHSLLGGSMVLGALDEDDWNRAAAELTPGLGADALSPPRGRGIIRRELSPLGPAGRPMVMVSWIPILVVLTIVVVAAIAVGMAATSKGSRTVMLVLVGLLLIVLTVGAVVFALRPANMEITVTSDSTGRPFVGRFIIDDRAERIEGVTPATFSRYGSRIQYAIIPTERSRETLSVGVQGTRFGAPYGSEGEFNALFGKFRHASRPVSDSGWALLSSELIKNPVEASTASSAGATSSDDEGH